MLPLLENESAYSVLFLNEFIVGNTKFEEKITVTFQRE